MSQLRIHFAQYSHGIRKTQRFTLVVLLLLSIFLTGCGSTKVFTATEQLLMSDAVDGAVGKLDFRPLCGAKVFLDTTYITAMGKQSAMPPMHNTNVNSDYIISAIRQQMTAAGCLLVDTKDTADVICEARCGAIGIDGHSVTYGLPANNFLSSASAVVGGTGSLPAIPELSLAKREIKSAATKVAVFAYDRETREPIYQTGIAQAGSNARDTWFLGIGPIQQGSIYRGTRFAGKRFQPGMPNYISTDMPVGLIDHRSGVTFPREFIPESGEYLMDSSGISTGQEMEKQ
ncbi:DUF6655 family protein [Pirellulaceae bacterium SH449]